MKTQILNGIDRVCFGDRRADIAKKYGNRYKEIGKNRFGMNKIGVIGRSAFVYFDPEDRVEFIQAVKPRKLVDESGKSVPLSYSLFTEWASEYETKSLCGIVYIPSLVFAISFLSNDDGSVTKNSPAVLCQFGANGLRNTEYFSSYKNF